MTANEEIIAACQELLAHYQAKCRGKKTDRMLFCPLCEACGPCYRCPWVTIEGISYGVDSLSGGKYFPCEKYIASVINVRGINIKAVREFNSSRKWARIRVKQLKRWISELEATQ